MQLKNKKYCVANNTNEFEACTHGRMNFKDISPLMTSLLVIFVWGGENSLGRGGGQRKDRGQQYTSIVPSSMGATVHKLGRIYQP